MSQKSVTLESPLPLRPAEARRASAALATAAERNDLEAVRTALTAADDPSRPCGPMRVTALQLAADHGDAGMAVLQELLGSGARADAADKLGRTPLHHAAAVGSVAATRALLRAGADSNARFQVDTLTAAKRWATAVGHGSADSLDVVAGDGLPLPECWGRTPLHLAVKGNFPEVVAQLLRAGAAVDAEDERGLSPLLLAGAGVGESSAAAAGGALQSYERVVALLAGAGADARRRHPDTGASALHHAAQLRSPAAAEALLRAGAEPAAAAGGGGAGATPLHEAAGAGALPVVRLLLEYASDALVNVPDQGGYTALHKAAYAGSRPVASLLLAHGGDLAARTVAGTTALQALLEGIPRPAVFLSSLLDSCVRANGVSVNDRDFKIYVNLAPLCPHGPKAQMLVACALMEALQPRPLVVLFQHPLLQLFVHLKWRRLLTFFMLFVFLHLTFVISLSAYAVDIVMDGPQPRPQCDPAWWSLAVSACIVVLYLAGQLLLLPRHYVREAETWLHVSSALLAFAAAVVPVFVQPKVECLNFSNITKCCFGGSLDKRFIQRNATAKDQFICIANSTVNCTRDYVLENFAELKALPSESEVHLLSVALLLAWAEVMLLLGRFSTVGYYSLMFQTVLKNVLKVLLSFGCLVVGFALSYEVQYSRAEQFSTPWKAIVRTTVMMTGEFDYKDLYNDPSRDKHQQWTGKRLTVTSRVIFLTFIILAPIVLMNLMMGLAVSDIQALLEEGLVRMTLKQADFVAHLEALTWRMERRSLLRGLHRSLLTRAVPTSLTLQPLFPAPGQPRPPDHLLETLAALALRNRERERRRRPRRAAPPTPVPGGPLAPAHSPGGTPAQRPLGSAASLPAVRSRVESQSDSTSTTNSEDEGPYWRNGAAQRQSLASAVRVRLEVEDTSAGELSPPPANAASSSDFTFAPALSSAATSQSSPHSARRPSELTLSERRRSPSPGPPGHAAARANKELARQVRRLRREVALLRDGLHSSESAGREARAVRTAFRSTFRHPLRSTFRLPSRASQALIQVAAPAPAPAPAPASAPRHTLMPASPEALQSPPPRAAPPRGRDSFTSVAASVRESLAMRRLHRFGHSTGSDTEPVWPHERDEDRLRP